LAAAALIAFAGCSIALPKLGSPANQGAPTAASNPAAPASNPAAPESNPAAPASNPAAPEPPATTQPADVPPPVAGPPAPGSTVDVSSFVDQVSTASKNVKTYTMTMNMKTTVSGSAMTTVATGKVDVSNPATTKIDMTMTVAGMKIRIIQIGKTSYVNMLGKWTKQASSAEATQTTGDIFAQTKDAFTDVKYVGPETVNKTATQHYSMTLDAAKLAQGLSGASGNLGKIKYDLWIDASSFPRKIAMSFGGDAPTSMTMTMDNINKPVSIKAPI